MLETRRKGHSTFLALALALACTLAAAWWSAAFGRNAPGEATATQMADPAATSAPAILPADTRPAVARHYGLWVLAPALAAILLAIATRQVVPALAAGIFVAAFMILPFSEAGGGSVDAPSIVRGIRMVVRGIRVAVEDLLIGAVVEPGESSPTHAMILLFTFFIGGMVGVMGASGGTRAMVEITARLASNSRRAQLATFAAGGAVFFDDYANAMIIGPTMRPLYDRLKISRAKLAYIVDSTAAPVSSIVPIATWIGAEIGFINQGLQTVAGSAHGTPGFMSGLSAYGIFLASIGYRFYVLFALILVVLIGLTLRDFGPMKKAERKAAAGGVPAETHEEQMVKSGGRWWHAVLPVLVLVVVTLALLVVTGKQKMDGRISLSAQGLIDLLQGADPNRSILYGSLAGMVTALVITFLSRALPFRAATDAMTEGMTRMFPATLVLVLAWALAAGTRQLCLGDVAGFELTQRAFQPVYLPMAVFGAACIVSFATGTSWGTMGILCPVAIEVAAKLFGDLPTDQAMPLFYCTVGAVLAGSVFGDHCSPISDTTVLSALASNCGLEEHVWTQAPYALLAAGTSVVAGYVLCNLYGQPWWMGLVCGSAAMLLFLLIVGRGVRKKEDLE